MAHVWHAVDDVPAAFAQLVAERRPGSIALSGGGTARDCYRAVAGHLLVWSATEFFLGDERWVPVTDPESNEGMARGEWLDAAAPAAVHSMVDAAGPGLVDIEAAAQAYEDLLRTRPPLDLVHLGLGPDGHTASLFPDSTALEVTDRWVIATGDDAHPHARLTLTFPAIAAARHVVVTVAGAGKRDALARVRAGDRSAPAARVDAPEVIWLVDAAAWA
jgi:6-phosphogluconolactonase